MSNLQPTPAPSFKRPILKTIVERLRERRRFIQVLAGPRQAGKTTLARQMLQTLAAPSHYASADEPTLRERGWLEAQWEIGRLRLEGGGGNEGILVLDEIQKVPGWSETVKRLWDEDTATGQLLKVVLLGSSPLLMQRGLTESLAGRFELIRVSHWTYPEMREAFGWTLDQFVFFGGYPGAAPLIEDQSRWSRYILDSLVETTLSRDILLLTRVDKPALLRQLFRLGCDYSAQVLSYQKMLGQLQDAGNTTTLAHYLDLLSGAGMLTGLQKFSGAAVRRRGSSPKLLILNTALMTASSGLSFDAAREDRNYWGRLVETAVGAHLVNALAGSDTDVYYWRERNREVDFVLHRNSRVVEIEVTSGRAKDSLPGIDAFARVYRTHRRLLVGGQGIAIEEFLEKAPDVWMR